MRVDHPHKSSRAVADPAKSKAVLEQKLRQQARERWLTENRAGVDAYDEQVEKHGVFSDGLRTF
jgi:antitoxin CcdA